MKQPLIFCVIACLFVPAICTESVPKPQEALDYIESMGGGRRTLTGKEAITGPCAYFNFENGKCASTPALNPTIGEDNRGLSVFAHQWIDYTCCNVVTEPMSGIIAAVWLWLQVCTKAMNTMHSNPKFITYDQEFAKEYEEKNNVLPYNGGPLRSMKRYCPQDLDGGELSEWVVSTFFPVMTAKNPNFTPINTDVVANCKVKKNTGAVTILFTEPEKQGRFGHFAMVLHDDHTLTLPSDLDNKHYVSFSNYGNTIGAMITGTKASPIGFGRDLQNVTQTMTLYNANVTAMMGKWKKIKNSHQMFDLLEWNCARAAFEVLNAGYPDCKIPLDQLWTPDRAVKFAQQLEPITNEAVVGKTTIAVKTITARHIVPKTKGVDVTLVVVIALCCFFGTLLLASLVAVIVIMRIKAAASQQLDRNLANLLISAASVHKGGPPSMVLGIAVPTKKPSKNAVAPALGDTIQEQMEIGQTDGKTDEAEFMKWAKEHGFTPKQAKLMWSDLDRDHNHQVTRDEWEKYIAKRPNLKWLATRLQSVANH